MRENYKLLEESKMSEGEQKNTITTTITITTTLEVERGRWTQFTSNTKMEAMRGQKKHQPRIHTHRPYG